MNNYYNYNYNYYYYYDYNCLGINNRKQNY
jgi:hypothetical protein